MKKENKLVNKVKRLIRRAGLPRWLHRKGPKTYEFWQHAVALLVKQECRLGYRRVSWLLDSLGFKVPTYSALAKMFARIPFDLWQRLIKATCSYKMHLVAIDGTGFSRPLPSPYYYKRIDKPYPIDVGTKASIAVDTRTKKILAIRIRAKPRHDILDAKYLIKRLPKKPNKLVADKAYDAEWMHKYCCELGIQTHIPIRKWSRGRHKNMGYRKMAQKRFNKRTYNRRNMVESTIKAIKTKFGASISSVKISAQRAEMCCKAVAHNIFKYYRFLSTHPAGLYISLIIPSSYGACLLYI